MAQSSNLPNQTQNHVRVLNSLLGGVEKKALLWMAARTPAWVTPDILTTIGMLGSILIFLGYTLTIYHSGFIWVASFGFWLNWFGDSMDGTLARFRKIERPRYGFFVDHIMDAISVVLIFIGIGLSPYVRFELALLTLVVYLMVSIFVYLSTYVNGIFRISYGGLGPTETRVIAVLANTFVFFASNPSFRVLTFQFTFYDVVAAVLCVLGLLIFSISSIQMASSLSKADREARREQRKSDLAARKRLRQAKREEMKRRRAPGLKPGASLDEANSK